VHEAGIWWNPQSHTQTLPGITIFVETRYREDRLNRRFYLFEIANLWVSSLYGLWFKCLGYPHNKRAMESKRSAVKVSHLCSSFRDLMCFVSIFSEHRMLPALLYGQFSCSLKSAKSRRRCLLVNHIQNFLMLPLYHNHNQSIEQCNHLDVKGGKTGGKTAFPAVG
jgi:hypothetical protein